MHHDQIITSRSLNNLKMHAQQPKIRFEFYRIVIERGFISENFWRCFALIFFALTSTFDAFCWCYARRQSRRRQNSSTESQFILSVQSTVAGYSTQFTVCVAVVNRSILFDLSKTRQIRGGVKPNSPSFDTF